MAPNVRLLAISFASGTIAAAAAAMLNRAFEPVDGMELAPFGRQNYPGRSRSMLVGRFQEDVIDAVRFAVKQGGGTIEVDLPEDEPGT
jgi:hypothetical protein